MKVCFLRRVNSIPTKICIRIRTNWYSRSSTHFGEIEIIITSGTTTSFLYRFYVKSYLNYRKKKEVNKTIISKLGSYVIIIKKENKILTQR